MLHYKGVNESLPTTKTPQPGSVQPWTFEQEAKIVASSALMQVGPGGRLLPGIRAGMAPPLCMGYLLNAHACMSPLFAGWQCQR